MDKHRVGLFIICIIASFWVSGQQKKDTKPFAGIFYTPEELAVWQQRAVNGPFKSAGDAFENSPGDWDRMKEDAETFLNHDRFDMAFEGPSKPVREGSELHKNYGELSLPVLRMMTAAFVDLVQNTEKYKPDVKRILLEQAQHPGVDFTNRKIYQGELFDDNTDVVWLYAEWQMKFLRAYDYLGRDYFTSEERDIIEKWLKDGAEWHKILVQKALSELYANQRGSVPVEQYKLSDLPGPGELTHHNGYTTYKSGRYYNNRRVAQINFIAHAGVLTGDESMKKEASDSFKEWLAFWWFPDGYYQELHRSATGRPQGGIGYGPNTLTNMVEVAKVLYEDGSENLFEYSTNVYVNHLDGSLSRGTVNKNIEWAILQIRKNFMEQNSPKIYPKGTADFSDDILMHYCLGTHPQVRGHRVKPCEASAIANRYYNNPEIREIYRPSGKLCGYPSNPTSQGVFNTWNGAGGTYPGYMFQFADLINIIENDRKSEVAISEEIYKNTPHFKVVTPSATWYIEKQSGGCSSLSDQHGRDWIDFKKTGNQNNTNSADSDYRGLPNLVFGDPGNGIGHPGFDQCTTELVSKNELLVQSKNEKWQFRWIFHDSFTEIVVEKTDTSRNYWFLYEGPVGGKFSPETHYWGTSSDGLRTDKPSIFKNPASGNWQWVFFGDNNINSTLFVAQLEKDSLPGFFAYMGNSNEKGNLSEDGMNVFGFGRSLNTKPLLSGRNRFFVGFFHEKANNPESINTITNFINKIIYEH